MTTSPTLDTTVIEILADVLNEPGAALAAQPILAAHEWDSLASLEALAQLESRFGVTLDLRSFHGARTVDDMVDLVRSAVGA